MTKEEAKERIEKLKELIERYRYSYHVLDKSMVSDEVNDSLKHELQDIENEYPDLITSDSPTQRVGGKPLEKFTKIIHSQPMLSLTDAFSFDELKDWETRNNKYLRQNFHTSKYGSFDYFCELKMDGLAVSLIYENGIFVRGATRGDGRFGEEVTQNLKTIESIPLNIDAVAAKIEIRGEIYLLIKTFENLNKKYQKEGKAILANPRNAAAGSIRQLDPKISAERKLDFVAWDLLYHRVGDVKMVRSHQGAHEIMSNLGFKTIKQNRHCNDLKDVEDFVNEIDKKREKLPYQIDGIVVVINNNDIRESLGVVGKAPRGLIAYKFAPEETTTIVEDIQVNVGRTGVLTPVAFLKPVLVAGSTVSRATLHNEDELRKKDIRIGDTVVIRKAGDVIPEVKEVIKELRPNDAKEFHFPKTCPKCGGKVVRAEGFSAYKCVNKNCFVIRRRSLEHFVSRAAFDMAGLGPKILNKFLEEGLIKDAADLFDLKEGDIQPLERFEEKSAKNIVNSIQTHKNIEFPRFIYALGIPNVGEETAYDIANAINSKSEILNPKQISNKLKSQTKENWEEIADIGPVVAKSIYDYFKDKNNIDYIERLFQAGVVIKSSKRSAVSSKLSGKTFVFTGGLETISRDEAKKMVRDLGGDTSESVSKETDYLVAGYDAGSKLDKAQRLGVKILSEKEFLDMIK